MPGIQLNTQAPTFTEIQNRFSMDQGGKDHNIRFQDGRGLYTSDKASLASVKNLFGFSAQLEARATKRDDGVTQIKQAIDRQYGNGMADRVLQHINQHQGRDLAGGMKRSDLGLIRQTADEIRQQDRRDAALADPNIDSFKGFLNYNGMQTFFDNHFEVMTDPKLWATQHAQMNVDNLGSALSMNVLNRIQQNGTITQRDLDDLSKALRPYSKSATMAPDPPPAPALGGHLVGPANEQRMQELTQVVYDRFMGPGAPFLVNMSSDETRTIEGTFNQPQTSAQRMTEMNRTLGAALGHQAIAASTVNTMMDALR
jgi:hypothetical protein